MACLSREEKGEGKEEVKEGEPHVVRVFGLVYSCLQHSLISTIRISCFFSLIFMTLSLSLLMRKATSSTLIY